MRDFSWPVLALAVVLLLAGAVVGEALRSGTSATAVPDGAGLMASIAQP